jgi:hypothetical protein
MAVVPIPQRRVSENPLPGEHLQAADFGAGLRAVGQGMENLGQEGAHAAQTWDAINATVDEANAKKSYNLYIQHSDDVLHSGADPFYARTGKLALEARADVEKSLQSKREELIQGAATDRERRMLQDALDPRVQDDIKGVGAWTVQQGAQYNIDESKARVTLSSDDAAANALNPEISEKAIGTGLAEIDHLAGINGWGPDQTAAAKLKFTSGTRRDIATSFVYEGGQGPDVAERYLDAHQNEFTSDDHAAVQTHIRTQRNALEAEQRRADAEARRELRDQQHDAADRAHQVLDNITAGVPVPAKDLATAVNDARFAERPELVHGLEVGGFKNNLTVQWRDKSPAQIQAHLNDLGAKIAKAGDNPEPNDVIEFDHLTNLRNTSTEELRRDPLSWGASHLGLNVPPLNWTDPASIMGRAQIALQIHARTGAPVRPLTDEEAAAYTPLTSGTVAQKRALVDRLAMFGPLAGQAAQQVAPDDQKFVGMVGLATVKDRRIAHSLVTDAINGVEILKTKPKLIKADDAQRDFQAYVGPAFQLLPQTANGVLANAQAMFAADADRHGISEWSDGRKRWTQAVDRALGAYMDGGVKRGGIGTYNHQQIILPEGMSQPEFDLRVSRAQKDQIVRASNGIPTWSNDKALTVNEWKAQHFVAVGNGRYRLSDGQNFVTKRGGGFYEIDVNRIGSR